MINITKMTFSLDEIANSPTVIITDVSQIKKFENGVVTDEVIGYRYSAVCPCNKYEQIFIKTNEKKPSVTLEEIENNGGSIEAEVIGFEGRFYQNKAKDILFTAKAEKIQVVK